MTTKYRISLRHPLDGKKYKLDTKLKAYVTNVLMLGSLQGVPSFLLERRNVIVEKKTGLLKWELVPREDWCFGFKQKEVSK